MTPQEYQLTAQLAQGSATWRNYVTNLLNNPQIVNNSNYAEIFSTTTQASAGTTSANLVGLNEIDVSNGISLVDNAVVLSNSGVYLINWLGQFKFIGGGSGGNITTWFSINGTAVPNSAYTFFLPTSNNYQLLTNVEDIHQLNAGDRIQFHWWSDISPATNISLFYTAAGTNPTRPASPSTNVSIIQLS
jgi:hypothetical protein